MRILSLIAILIVAGLGLQGCVFLGIGAGLGAAGVAATQEGGLSVAAEDTRIQVQINDLWFKHDVEMFRKLDMTIDNGRVLLTGVVQNPDHRVEAVRLAWQPKGVKQVINEIRISESSGVQTTAQDVWITTRLRSEMIFNRDVQSLNYSIDTVQGTVYLMGFSQSQAELDRVVSLARRVPNVKQVVSYVKVRAPFVEGAASGGQ
jgi:osmotically-inducible protein OsmY